MSKSIKTKTTVKDIKILDKAASGTAHGRDAFIRSKQSSESTQDPQYHSASEYASDNITDKTKDTAQSVTNRLGNSYKKAAKNINKAKQRFQEAKQNLPKQRKQTAKQAKKAAENAKQTANTLNIKAELAQKTAEQAKKAVTDVKRTFQQTQQIGRQSIKAAKQAGKGVKATGKGTVKTAKKSVKTAEQTAKVAVKTAKQTAKVTQQSGKAAAKAAKLAAQASKAAAKAAVAATKAAVKSTTALVKATIAAVKGLAALIAAGGWIAIIIIIVCLVGLLVGSVYGVFFSTEANSTVGETIHTAMERISYELNADVEQIKSNNNYDVLDISGLNINWKNTIAVYAVKVATNPEKPQDTATIDSEKESVLRSVFRDMLTLKWEVKEIEVEKALLDERDNPTGDTQRVTQRLLLIQTEHRSIENTALQYGFTTQQNQQLRELLSPEYNDMWTSLLKNY